jgi:hypothetical protein
MKRAAPRQARVRALVGAAGVMLALVAAFHEAGAQRIDPRKPSVLVVGAPPGASPTHRVDARRSGVSKTPLPSGALHVAWKKATGLTIDQPALVGADGSLAVVSVRGDVTFIDAEGEERATVKVGAAQVGPALMTSDGTVVYTTSGGDVIGVRRTAMQPRFSTRIGGERNLRAAPIGLDDGGSVVATMTDLVVLDSEGNVRSRAALPETPAAPLIAAGDKILAVSTSGTVFGWTPGREPARVGSFGAPIDGGAVLADGGQLLGVIEGNQLAAIDIARGGRSTRSIAAQGLYLGPPAGTATTTLLALTATRGFVVTLDPSGLELARAPIAASTQAMLPDGGAPPLTAPPHVGPLVDARGAVAFAATDGHVGVVGPDGAVDTIGETLCAKGARSGVVGLTPFGNGAFAVTCDGGVVVRVTGASAEPVRPAPPPAASSADPSRLRTRN